MLDTRATGLQAEIDTLIARLAELRRRPACASHVYDDNADDLRALAELAKDTARAFDPIFQRIGFDASVGSMSGASEYRAVVSNAIEGELLFAITDRAERIRGCATARG